MIIGTLAVDLDMWALSNNLNLSSAQMQAILRVVSKQVTRDSTYEERFELFTAALSSAEFLRAELETGDRE